MARASRSPRTELLRGTLDLLILQTLSIRPLHGYGIAQHIARLSNDALSVEQGSLYPALERLQARGWVTSKWEPSPTGRRQLGAEISAFDAVLLAINRVLRRA